MCQYGLFWETRIHYNWKEMPGLYTCALPEMIAAWNIASREIITKFQNSIFPTYLATHCFSLHLRSSPCGNGCMVDYADPCSSMTKVGILHHHDGHTAWFLYSRIIMMYAILAFHVSIIIIVLLDYQFNSAIICLHSKSYKGMKVCYITTPILRIGRTVCASIFLMRLRSRYKDKRNLGYIHPCIQTVWSS